MTGTEAFALEAQTAADFALDALQAKSAHAVWPRTLVLLIDVLAATLQRMGHNPEQAEIWARALVLAQAHYIGGRAMYLPVGRKLETALLHDAIYRAHRRGNTDELARQHGLTTRAIQKIVRQQTLLHRARVQAELFPATTKPRP